jgi:hypothetical protein
VIREEFDCPIFCKALNSLQNKLILAPKSTPFLDDRQRVMLVLVKCKVLGDMACEGRAWPRNSVAIISW